MLFGIIEAMNKDSFKMSFEWIREKIRSVLDSKYYDKVFQIVCLIVTTVGGCGVVYSLARDVSVSGNGNSVEIGDRQDNRKISGAGDISGNGNLYVQGDVNANFELTTEIVGRIAKEMANNLKPYIDERIQKPQDVTVVNEKPLLIKNPKGLDYLARAARESLANSEYSNAVELAQAAYSLINAELKPALSRERFHVEGAFIGNMERVYPVLIEEALAKSDFKLMGRYTDEYCSLFQDFNPFAEALRTISDTRHEGRKLVFFSPEELRFLRTLSNEKLIRYLSILSHYGYLQPITPDYATKTATEVDYSKLFGLDCALPYLGSFYIRACSTNGARAVSNKISPLWGGFGRTEFVDNQLEVSLALGLQEKDRVTLPIELKGESSNSGKHIFSTLTVETKLTWEKSKDSSIEANYYEVILKDYEGETLLCQTNNTSYDTSQMCKVPEPSTGILLLIGISILTLRRRCKNLL